MTNTNAELTARVTVLEARLELLLSCYQELAEDVGGAHHSVGNINDRLAEVADCIEEGL